MAITFPEIAQTLHGFAGGSIREFTSNLLTGGLTSREEYVEELDPSTLRNYYHGNRQLTRLWADLYDVWEEQEFIRYVETTYKAESFESISKCISKLGFEITPDNVPERLAVLFSSIMDEVLKDAVPKQTKLPVKTEQAVPRMLTHDRELLADTLEELAEALQYVQDPLHDFLLTWDLMNAQERAEYEKDIMSHVCTVKNCSKKLDLYAKRYPGFSELSKLCKNGQKIFMKYYAVHTRQELSDYETYLKELCDTMDQVSKKLIDY